jgi:hypothetical protein
MYIVLETFPDIQYTRAVVDENGLIAQVDTWEEAVELRDRCQKGIIVEVN